MAITTTSVLTVLIDAFLWPASETLFRWRNILVSASSWLYAERPQIYKGTDEIMFSPIVTIIVFPSFLFVVNLSASRWNNSFLLDGSLRNFPQSRTIASIKTVNTDVVVIAISLYNQLDLEKLWIEFGNGIHLRWLPIHEYMSVLGEDTCKTLPIWFAFTCCDTVSGFHGRGKKMAWNTFKSYPPISSTFKR